MALNGEDRKFVRVYIIFSMLKGKQCINYLVLTTVKHIICGFSDVREYYIVLTKMFPVGKNILINAAKTNFNLIN